MSSEAIRVAVTRKLEAALAALVSVPNFKLKYENRETIDMSTQKDPFACVEIILTDTYQASLGVQQKHKRYMGTVYLEICVLAGTGTSSPNIIADHFCEFLEIASFEGVNTMAGSIGNGRVEKGWYKLPMGVPFWSDKFA